MKTSRTVQKQTATGRLRRRQGLSDEVYEALYGMIMKLEIAPGARISVDALARDLGVSQTPLREALSRLEVQGLVVKTHLVGYSAAPQLDEKRLRQLYDLRLLLEPHVAAEAAQNMSPDDVERLVELDVEMRTGTAEDLQSYAEFAELDGRFHDLIARGSGNDVIHETLTRLHIHVHLFRSSFQATATDHANLEHEGILAAIQARDSSAAHAAMSEHILRSRDRFVKGCPKRRGVNSG
ncbi:GntR family transcriptional regulator [uncultured Martelella sp.]|uniref:GntR family transcriptional regulator n=1 Tax=uncultured Martelella sp. TaxID=392331 RepID=UPI0029C75B72|nr:GntR family transcriptional regulator [uncultured Martelella sp.]